VRPYTVQLAEALAGLDQRLTGTPAERPRPPRNQPPQITGEWLLTLPAGYEYAATIEPTDTAEEYRLVTKAVNLRGVYRLEGRKLAITQPVKEKMSGLAWDVLNNNAIVLVEQSPRSSPADYRRATLTRGKPPLIREDGQ
jgi:hypothetical protein